MPRASLSGLLEIPAVAAAAAVAVSTAVIDTRYFEAVAAVMAAFADVGTSAVAPPLAG